MGARVRNQRFGISGGVVSIIGIVAAPPGAVTSSIAYSGGVGASATIGASGRQYVSPSISAPGVSPILKIPGVAGLTAPRLSVGDVPPSVIVRAGC
jgi:hypothetical protein